MPDVSDALRRQALPPEPPPHEHPPHRWAVTGASAGRTPPPSGSAQPSWAAPTMAGRVSRAPGTHSPRSRSSVGWWERRETGPSSGRRRGPRVEGVVRRVFLEMPHDLVDHRGLGEEGDDLHLRTAARTGQRVALVDPPDQARPARPALRLRLTPGAATGFPADPSPVAGRYRARERFA